MLVDASSLLNYPVLSLHEEGQIAATSDIVVDPNELKVVAFRVVGPGVTDETGDFLQVKDVREYSGVGMVVDSSDEFVNGEDVIKLKEILDLGFYLPGMKVVTRKGTKLGKVIDFTIDPNGFSVQQIRVQRPLMKSFLDPELLIGRSEVVNITDDKIIVKDEEAKIREKALGADFVPNFVNPFREPSLSTFDNQNLDEPSAR